MFCVLKRTQNICLNCQMDKKIFKILCSNILFEMTYAIRHGISYGGGGGGQLGRNSHPRGRKLTLNGTQGEVGVSLKK